MSRIGLDADDIVQYRECKFSHGYVFVVWLQKKTCNKLTTRIIYVKSFFFGNNKFIHVESVQGAQQTRGQKRTAIQRSPTYRKKPHKKPTSHLIPINRTCRCVDAASRRKKNANRSYSRKKKLMLKYTELTATNAETSDKRIPQPQPQEAPQKRSSPTVTNTV